jgi:hypothetical protein
MRHTSLAVLVIGGAIWLLAGCALVEQAAAPAGFTPQTVTPDARISLGEDQATEVSLGFVNETNRAVSQVDDFEGQWVLVNAEGATRAAGRVLVAGPLEPREVSYPLVYSAQLDAGEYTLLWGAPAIGTVTVQFTVMDGGAGVGVGRTHTSDEFLIEQTDATEEVSP